jgi:hypothetical protein
MAVHDPPRIYAGVPGPWTSPGTHNTNAPLGPWASLLDLGLTFHTLFDLPGEQMKWHARTPSKISGHSHCSRGSMWLYMYLI